MSDLQPLLLDLPALQKPQHEKGASLRQRWWAFHVANLHVYDNLKRMALQLKRAGYKRCGISLLWEQLRWQAT